jgi:hypothetical protein
MSFLHWLRLHALPCLMRAFLPVVQVPPRQPSTEWAPPTLTRSPSIAGTALWSRSLAVRLRKKHSMSKSDPTVVFSPAPAPAQSAAVFALACLNWPFPRDVVHSR